MKGLSFPMTWWWHILWLAALAYVAGATPFGFLAGRLRGIDIRQHGSGNIGATNAVRVLGKKIGGVVFALDALKGLLPVLLAAWWTQRCPAFDGHPIAASLAEVLAGLAAVAGHTATFWLGFKGGKGVATSAGVMLGLAPWALLAALLAWLISMAVCRYVSLSSIIAGWVLLAAVVAREWLRIFPGDKTPGAAAYEPNWPLLALSGLLCALVTWRHRSNLRRIAAGTEPKAWAKKEAAA